MGITISHKIGIPDKKNVKRTLDRTQKIAEVMKTEQANKVGVSFVIKRHDANCLYIDIGGCETLSFNFKTAKQILADGAKGWGYAWAVLTEDGKKELKAGYEIEKYPQNEMFYSASFCKTQYADKLVEHKWVADLVRSVASFATYAEVNDEGDYYHTGELEDASEAIADNGKLINSIGLMLAGSGFKDDQIIKGGETRIKPKRIAKKN